MSFRDWNKDHQLIERDKGYRCEVCGWTWTRHPGQSCPGLPRFGWWGSDNPPPEYLLTKAQMNDAGFTTGKKLAPPSAVISRSDSPDGWLKLYDSRYGVPKRKLSDAQKEALEKAHAASMESITCDNCGMRSRAYVYAGLCDNCRAEAYRKEEYYEVIRWAREMLNTPGVLILDTETTSLWGEVIELAVIDLEGNVLFNSRFRPKGEIDPGATRIHGISIDDLQDAPTWLEKNDELHGDGGLMTSAPEVLIYNKDYDITVLNNTMKLWGCESVGKVLTTCLMEKYAVFVGDWSSYWNDYRYPPLLGDHSALGDCRAALSVLKRMAGAELPEDLPDRT